MRTAILLASMLLYVVLQGAATAHAVEYGTGDHTHDGKTCTIASFSQRGDDLDVPTLVLAPQPAATWTSTAVPASPRLTPVTVTAAHPRGPPSIR